MPERLNGAVSKTVVGLWSTEGSNPSPSAPLPKLLVGSSLEQPRSKHRSHATWLLDDLSPAKPDDVPPGELECEVTLAVALERMRGVVRRTAIGLEHQAVFRPVKIHLVARNYPIHHRGSELSLVDKFEETALEFAPCRLRLIGEHAEQVTQPAGASTAIRSREDCLNLRKVENLQDERPFQCTV